MLHGGNFYANRSSTSTFSQPDDASVDKFGFDDFDEDGDGGSDEDESDVDVDGGNKVSNLLLSSNVRLGQSLAQ